MFIIEEVYSSHCMYELHYLCIFLLISMSVMSVTHKPICKLKLQRKISV